MEFCGASLGLPSRGSRTADVTGIQTAAQPNKSICCKYKNFLNTFYRFFVQTGFFYIGNKSSFPKKIDVEILS